jgi:hypothetical protein
MVKKKTKKIFFFEIIIFFIQGIMLVYDITSEKSFDNIKNWIRNIEEVYPETFQLKKHQNFFI